MYNRCCFRRDSSIKDLKNLVKIGVELPEHVPEKPYSRREPSTELQKKFCAEMDMTIANCGEVMPHEQDVDPKTSGLPEDMQHFEARVYIPRGMIQNQMELIREFITNKRLPALDDDQVAYIAHKLWKKFYWFVHIKKWMPFAVCDICSSTFAKLLAAKTDEERERVKAERQVHRDDQLCFRKNHEVHMELGNFCSDDVFSCVVDVMDNQKTQVPRADGKIHSKTLNSVGEWWCARLIGILVHGHGFFAAWGFPWYEGGACCIMTALLRVIHIVKERRGSLPPVLIIRADNCGRENKNQHMVDFLGWLVHAGFFKEARIYFLPVGHTHTIIDQHYSVVHRKIKNRPILDIEVGDLRVACMQLARHM